MIRPPGPLPRISRRSTPVCAAIFFARGDALTRPAATVTGAVRAGAGMPTAPALTAGAAGGGVGTPAGRRGRAGGGGGGGGGGAFRGGGFRAEGSPPPPP